MKKIFTILVAGWLIFSGLVAGTVLTLERTYRYFGFQVIDGERIDVYERVWCGGGVAMLCMTVLLGSVLGIMSIYVVVTRIKK